jgi:hypothetical protein
MTPISRTFDGFRAALARQFAHKPARYAVIAGSIAGTMGLVVLVAVVPPVPPTAAEQLAAYVDKHSQTLRVSEQATVVAITRDKYSTAPGVDGLVAAGTNYDWAKLVMLYAGWPQSEANVTVMVRWMRQENGANDWWNRNNPLNLGSGGFGTFPDLIAAAKSTGSNLHSNPGYAGIVAGFAAGTSTDATEQAIWASPWAGSHYGNGSRWHYTPVDSFAAPTGAW